MVMSAKIYTADELQIVRNRAVEMAVEGVASFYSDIGPQLGRALFFTYMRLWKSRPTMTCTRLKSHVTPNIFVIIQRLSMRLKIDSTIDLSRNVQFVDT